MTIAYFPGDSRYYAELIGWRVGTTVYGQLTVYKTAGTGRFSTGSWWAHIGGNETSGSWPYDFTAYSDKLVWTWSVPTIGPDTYRVAGYAVMTDIGLAQPADVYVTIPPDAPAAPSAFSATRVSDAQQNLAWTRNATVAAPYAAQQVLRKINSGTWSAYAAVASFGFTSSAGAQAWSDTTTVPNRMYQYRVKASNGGGEALSPESAFVFTTPGAPSALTAEKITSTSIQLALTQTVQHSYHQTQIEYTLNNGVSWAALTTLASGVTTYLWNAVPGGSSVRFRSRVIIDSVGSQGNGLLSSWKESNDVPLAAPPLAPSALAPNGVAFNAALAQLFTWQHNPADSSLQSAYEFRYRIGAGAWTSTGKITSGSSSRTVAASTFTNGNVYEWEVRTWGVHATASPWSPTATFTASAPPLVTITSPGATLGAALVTSAWTYSDPEGSPQSAWEAELLQGGTLLESPFGAGSTASVTFTTRLLDDTVYQIRVRVRDGAALWSAWDQVTFTTDFPIPAVPTAVITWDPEEGFARIVITNPAGTPTVVENQILRSVDGGQSYELADSQPANGTGFDRTVPLGTDVIYQVIAWSALPSSSSSVLIPFNTDYVGEVYVGPSGGYWSAGVGFNIVVRMKLGLGQPPKLDLSTGAHEKILHYYAGRSSAVESMGETMVRTGKVEFLVLTLEEMRRARQLATLPAPHLIRMPDGTTVYSSISEVSDSRVQRDSYTIDFQITEVVR